MLSLTLLGLCNWNSLSLSFYIIIWRLFRLPGVINRYINGKHLPQGLSCSRCSVHNSTYYSFFINRMPSRICLSVVLIRVHAHWLVHKYFSSPGSRLHLSTILKLYVAKWLALAKQMWTKDTCITSEKKHLIAVLLYRLSFFSVLVIVETDVKMEPPSLKYSEWQ